MEWRTVIKAWLVSSVIAFSAPAGAVDMVRMIGAAIDMAAPNKVDEHTELVLGQRVAGEMLGARPLVYDTKLQLYVNLVGNWIAANNPELQNIEWRFGVIDTDSANAYSAPGGYIFITYGMYRVMDTESELAGALAHEMVHVAKKHHVEVYEKSQRVAAQAKLIGSIFQGVNGVVNQGAAIKARQLDKQTEFDADKQAMILTARAGYSPYGIVSVLQKLRFVRADDEGIRELYATHPTADARLEALRKFIDTDASKLPQGMDSWLKVRRIVYEPRYVMPRATLVNDQNAGRR